jgi:small subunit ribosomal protein S5
MADELETTITPEAEAPAAEAVAAVDAPVAAAAAPADARGPRPRAAGARGGRPGGRPGSDRRGPRPPRAKSEFDSKMITIRRVSRVVAGGRRFSFSVAIIIGNKKGRVGVGLGKAGDTTLAIDKATRDAKKHMITLSLTKDSSIPHEVSAKFNASRVVLMPAKGRGLVAGSSVRPVLELAGISNIVAKVHSGSKNGLNNARAAIEALKTLKA